MINDEENQLPSNEASYTCVGSLEPDLNHCAFIISPAKTAPHSGLKEGCRAVSVTMGGGFIELNADHPVVSRKPNPGEDNTSASLMAVRGDHVMFLCRFCHLMG